MNNYIENFKYGILLLDQRTKSLNDLLNSVNNCIYLNNNKHRYTMFNNNDNYNNYGNIFNFLIENNFERSFFYSIINRRKYFDKIIENISKELI